VNDYIHIPVMAEEVLKALNPEPSGYYADGTMGMGGHSRLILNRSTPSGRVFGCDRDGAALQVAEQNLAEYAGRFELRRGNFAELGDWFEPGTFDGVLLDLGVSSPQLDVAERGFSFMNDGPLDMRMDDRQTITAADLVNNWDPAELMKIFWDYGDEPAARRIVRALVEDRQTVPFETTGQLAAFIERICPRFGKKKHPATRVFQALRIAVNDEMGALAEGLASALKILKTGGRMAVITFHSLEDRKVKEFGRTLERDYEVTGERDIPELRKPREPKLKRINRKAILPGPNELKDNPRARSAQLRVFEKLNG
jgi:16S rRNA (cytosine1402-N4)-methyltransferase